MNARQRRYFRRNSKREYFELKCKLGRKPTLEDWMGNLGFTPARMSSGMVLLTSDPLPESMATNLKISFEVAISSIGQHWRMPIFKDEQ